MQSVGNQDDQIVRQMHAAENHEMGPILIRESQ